MSTLVLDFLNVCFSFVCRVDEINEKMYDFEANKRNNLIFYGIANETRETQPKLLQKATKLLLQMMSLGIMMMVMVMSMMNEDGKELG